MEGNEREWRGCIENDRIGSKALRTLFGLIIVLYRVNTLVSILLCMNTMFT